MSNKTKNNVVAHSDDEIKHKWWKCEQTHNIQVKSIQRQNATDNTIKLKWLKYSCLWICNADAQIIDWITDISIETK